MQHPPATPGGQVALFALPFRLTLPEGLATVAPSRVGQARFERAFPTAFAHDGELT